jgi:hypothetical protein
MSGEVKKVPCAWEGCSNRRPHWSEPYKRRQHRMIEVPADYEGKAYCSIECQMYAEAK